MARIRPRRAVVATVAAAVALTCLTLAGTAAASAAMLKVTTTADEMTSGDGQRSLR